MARAIIERGNTARGYRQKATRAYIIGERERKREGERERKRETERGRGALSDRFR